MYFYFSYFNIFCPYEFLELIEILFCSILNRIGPDMSRYYRNSVFRQTSRGLVSTLDFVKTRKYFYCSYFYILCPYEFIELNEILFRSILNRIGPDMSRYYMNSVFRQTSKGLVSTQDFVKTGMYFYFSYFNIFCPYEFLELIEILFCSILNRIGPDMSRYYRNSVFRQTSRGLVSTLDFVKTRKYFYCSYFYILCPYEFIELNEILFRSILNRIGPDMSRYYRNSVFRQTSKGLVSTQDFVKTGMYFYCSYFYIFCPYEFLELIEILFCSILNRIGPDMSRYYRNSVFRQTSRGLVSTLDFVKTRKYFYCSYFYILCPYEFIELNEILFRSILNRIGPDMSRYYRNSVFRQTSKGLVSTQDFVKTGMYFYCSYFYIFCPYEFLELIEILFCSILNRIGPDMSRYYRNSVFRQTSRGLVSTLDFVKTRKYFYCSYFYILCPYEFIELNEILFRSILNRIGPDIIQELSFSTNLKEVSQYIGFCKN